MFDQNLLVGGDLRTLGLVGAVVGALLVATIIGRLLKRHVESGLSPMLVRDFNSRVQSWWVMSSVLAAAFLLGEIATVVLFGLISFWALREFITLTPTRPGDHRALFWVFFIFTPVQYVLVALGKYEVYSILIPVYAFLFIPARSAMAGDHKRFLERSAKVQAGLMICVYCLSYAPALLTLPLPPVDAAAPGIGARANPADNARLLFFFIVVVQLSDVLSYAWSKLLGQTVIAPAISQSKTWEGTLGGIGSATLLGAALYWATPFEPWEAAAMSALISATGLAGGLTMSAIKRDRGVDDYGALVRGHSGLLDRIDSVCFAAPVFFHTTRLLNMEHLARSVGMAAGG